MKQNRGSYLLGIIGAFLGALVAMIPFGIIYNLGYLVFYLGFLYSILPAAGYDLLGGKRNYFKIPVVFVFGLVALVSTLFVKPVYDLIANNVMAEWGRSNWDIPWFIYEYIQYDREVRFGIMKDLGLSLLIYLIGTIYMIKQTIVTIRAEKAMFAHNQQAQQMSGNAGAVIMPADQSFSGSGFAAQPASPQNNWQSSAIDQEAISPNGVDFASEESYYREEEISRPEE